MPRPQNAKAGPKTARERKAAFDLRMKNEGRRADPGEPERSASVLYLSRQARDVLTEHRKLAALVMDGPRKDSQLVESLLLGVKPYSLVQLHTDMASPETEAPETLQALRARVMKLNEKLLDAEKNLADRDRDLTQFIETRHGDEFWYRYAALVSDVVAIVLDTNGTGTDSKYRIHRLLLDYMLDLTEYPRAACRSIE